MGEMWEIWLGHLKAYLRYVSHRHRVTRNVL